MESDIKLFIPPTRKDQRKMIDEYIHSHLLTSECMYVGGPVFSCLCVSGFDLIWHTHMYTYVDIFIHQQ